MTNGGGKDLQNGLTLKSKKLYENHVQPITPLDNNYYCLLDKNTVEWQTSLMKNIV